MSDASRKLVQLGLLGVAGYVAYQFYLEYSDPDSSNTDASDSAVNAGATGVLQTLYENAVNALGISNWMSTGEGPQYVPILNATETQYGIPPNLLARIAYQESHFRPDIISGATRSPAGAVGIMQLMPQYFPNAGASPESDIDTAGNLLSQLYNQFQDWQVAVAAYNDGAGNIQAYLNGTKTLPAETQNYVAGVIADVPVSGSLIEV